MKQIVLQFISGADAHKEQTFDVSEDLSITIGREATNKIVVADTEIMVSRKHATIRFASTFDSTEENPQYELIIVDSSSNGTFVNGKKVNQSVPVTDEDEIQLGEKGPKLKLTCFPKQAKATRIMEASKEKETIVTPRFTASTSSAPASAPSPRQTTTDYSTSQSSTSASSKPTTSNNLMKLVGGGLAVLFGVGGAGVYYYQQNKVSKAPIERQIEKPVEKQKSEPKDALPQKILSEWAGATVRITAFWQMVDSETNSPVYHKFDIADFSGQKIPVYRKKGNSIEPLLTSNPIEGDRIFGGMVVGTGFVVSKDGMIMTNANIIEKWMDPFEFPNRGIVIEEHKAEKSKDQPKTSIYEITPEQFSSLKDWKPVIVQHPNIPTDSKSMKGKSKQPAEPEKVVKLIGQNTLLEVKFPGSDLKLKGRLVVLSEKHNVALIKVDVASPIKALELDNNVQSSTVSGGERVVMLGYPAMSSKIYISQEKFKNLDTNTSDDIPDDLKSFSEINTVSVAEGIISKIPANRTEGKKSRTTSSTAIASRGDYIEMSMNYSGEGNSGGPVFNTDGKVIGIFTSNISGKDIGANIGLAVPISYGLELLNPTQRIVK